LAQALRTSLARDNDGDRDLSERSERLFALLAGTGPDLESAARHVAQELVLLVQASLLRRYAPGNLADAFIKSRFDGPGRVFGAAESPLALSSVLERAWRE
jgi:putative acyl-CoA dehydrogenase